MDKVCEVGGPPVHLISVGWRRDQGPIEGVKVSPEEKGASGARPLLLNQYSKDWLLLFVLIALFYCFIYGMA